MTTVKAETTVKINGGVYGVGTSRAEFVLETESEFSTKFCSMHPNTNVDYDDADEPYNSNKKEENWYCAHCRKQDEIRFHELLEAAKIDCAHLTHTHECHCHLGHDCNLECPERIRVLKEAEEQGEGGEPNPFLVLAAEAPPKTTLGVYTRLSALEEENAALKAVLGKVIANLPESAREALGSPEVLQRATSGASD